MNAVLRANENLPWVTALPHVCDTETLLVSDDGNPATLVPIRFSSPDRFNLPEQARVCHEFPLHAQIFVFSANMLEDSQRSEAQILHSASRDLLELSEALCSKAELTPRL
jgi:hypothetical protein